jgi:hypothetical protein
MSGERQPRDRDALRDDIQPDVGASASSEDEVEHRCDLCGAPMKEWHCRIICNYCGYQRDCSDP